MRELTDLEKDSLKEVGNVGVGNAATALSKLISKKIDISIPCSEFVPISEFSLKAGGPESIVYCLYVNISGDLDGEALFFFDRESSLKLVDMMMGKEAGTAKEMDEMAQSALNEMSNIVVGSYLSSMANMLSMKIFPSPANSAEDMLQSIIDAVLAKLSKSADELLYIQTEINIEDKSVKGSFTLLFDYKSLEIVLGKLKEIYGV